MEQSHNQSTMVVVEEEQKVAEIVKFDVKPARP